MFYGLFLFESFSAKFSATIFIMFVRLYSLFFFLGFLLLGSPIAFAATRTWDGGGGTGLCSTATNWSSDTVPVAGDTVIFNTTSTTVTWDSSCPSAIASMSLATGFTGRVVLGQNFTLTGSLTLAENQLLDLRRYDVDASGASVSNSGIILLKGTQTATNIPINTTAGTIQFDGASTPLSLGAFTAFYNLVLSGTGTYQSTRDITVVNSAIVRGRYAYQRTITIDHTKVSGTGTLTDFPFYFSLTDDDLKSIHNGGQIWTGSGYDIAFVDADGATLDFEIDEYIPVTGTYSAWVRIPTLSPTEDVTIYLMYGSPSITTTQERATSVWDSNYGFVHHLNRSGSVIYDATSNGNNGGSLVKVLGGQTGKLGKAYQFSTSTGGRYTIANNASLNGWDDFTVSAWGKLTNSSVSTFQGLVARGWASAGSWKFQRWTNGGSPGLLFQLKDGAASFMTRYSACTCLNDQWYYYVGVFDKQNFMKTYVDGVLGGTKTISNTGTNTTTASIYVGADPFGQNWYGLLDEIRLSKVVRSDGWIATEYANQSSPSTFITAGAQSDNVILGGSTWNLIGYTVSASAASFVNGGIIVVGTGSFINISTLTVSDGTTPGTITMSLADANANTNGTSLQTVTVVSDNETFTLTETGVASGIFTATVPTACGTNIANSGIIEREGSTSYFIHTQYTDSDDSTDIALVTSQLIDGCTTTSAAPITSGGGGSRSRVFSPIVQRYPTTTPDTVSDVPQVAGPPSRSSKRQSQFRDVPMSAWFFDSVQNLVSYDIVSGYRNPDGSAMNVFGPADLVTYAQLAKMLLKIRDTLTPNQLSPTAVSKNISAQTTWAEPYIAEAEKILSLYVPSLDVHQPLSRGEVAQTLLDFLKKKPQSDLSNPFVDLPEFHPYHDALLTTVSMGLFSGDDTGHTVRPDDNLSRAESAKLLSLLLKMMQSQ